LEEGGIIQPATPGTTACFVGIREILFYGMADAYPDPATGLKKQPLRWKFKSSQTRWLFYLLILLGIAAWKYAPRPWHPSITLETAHHIIYSSASQQQTEDTAHAMNLLSEG
jgi:hypothetical protein